jgi:hypothetical protein
MDGARPLANETFGARNRRVVTWFAELEPRPCIYPFLALAFSADRRLMLADA